MLANVPETAWGCSWKAFENEEQWELGIDAYYFQITNLSCVSVTCNPANTIFFMCKVNFLIFFYTISPKSKYIHWVNIEFLISWVSVWFLLKCVVAFVLVKSQQWPLKALLNVAQHLHWKKSEYSQYAPLVLRLQAPGEGVWSQPANLPSWLFLDELYHFLLQFQLIHLVILLSPQVEHALLCNEIIMSSLAFCLCARPHFVPVFLFIVSPEQFQGGYSDTVL